MQAIRGRFCATFQKTTKLKKNTYRIISVTATNLRQLCATLQHKSMRNLRAIRGRLVPLLMCSYAQDIVMQVGAVKDFRG
jgi:hypothetical protein